MRCLVIGYGNPSRRDDGVGWFVIERLRDLRVWGVECVTAHQLEIEFADAVQRYDWVIFVDAAVDTQPGQVTVRELAPNVGLHAVTHFQTPEDVLGMCLAMHGRAPKGILISIGGADFDFGEGLTEVTQQAGEKVALALKNWLQYGKGQKSLIG